MLFQMTHKFFPDKSMLGEKGINYFDENSAPDWLTGINTRKGSTMDVRWFWKEHVLTLKVGQTVSTDFRIIKRIKYF